MNDTPRPPSTAQFVSVDPLIGSSLGANYRVLERLGEGGMGTVYVVEHVGLKKRFAAKVLSPQMAGQPEARARFELEAHAASKLEHDHIVSVTDLGVAADGRPYLVMELLKGRTLYDHLSSGVPSLEETIAIVVPVCEGLAHAHAEGFVHRDVKPENVFLVNRPGGRFVIKVLDFGISKSRLETSRLTQNGQVMGSPLYMAPEMCRGEEVDHRADIYAVGVILYQMVCGVAPFSDPNMLKLMQMQVHQAVVPPRMHVPALPVELEQVMMRALAKDPEARYQSIDAFADELIAALPAGADRLLYTASRTPTSTGSAPQAVVTGSRFASEPRISGSQASIRVGSNPDLVGGEVLSRAPTVASASLVAATSASSSVIGVDGAGRATSPPAAGSRRWLLIGLAVLLLGSGAVWAIRGGAPPSSQTTVAAPTTGAPSLPSSPPPPVAAPAVAPPAPASAPVAAPAAPAPRSVRIQITSTPPGAQVVLAGRALGTTPLDATVEAAASGAPLAELRLELDGHRDLTRQVDAGADVTLDLTLAPVRRKPAPSSKPAPTTAPATPTPPPAPLEIRQQR